MKMKNLVVAVALCIVSNASLAACQWGGGISTVGWSISPGAVHVKTSDPIGTVLFTRQLNSAQNSGSLFACNAGESASMQMSIDYPVAGMPNVYSTNVPGVGIRVADKTGRYFGQPGDTVPSGGRWVLVGEIAPLTFDIIKTGPTSLGGVLNNAQVFNLTIPGVSTLKFYAQMGTGSIIHDNSCSVTNTVIPVEMGNDIPVSEFKGVGTTAREKDLTIALVCDQSTRVSITFDGVQASGYPNILALSPVANAATGVGIQLSNKSTGTPLPLKTPISMGTASTAGPLDLEFTARYYQISEKVTGGPAGATADFTMAYN